MKKLSCGIVGLPNVGKSTLFNALTRKGAMSANYPFCTIEPNVGIVPVDDKRLPILSKLSGSKTIIPAFVTFVDIAGLVEGASKGEGLGNQFLSHIRETDALVHLVRCFQSDEIIHVVEGPIDPLRDSEVIYLELILHDLQMIDNILKKVEKQAKSNKELAPVVEVLLKAKQGLDQEKGIDVLPFTDEEKALLAPYAFLTKKKMLYGCNVSEDDLPSMENSLVALVRKRAEEEGRIAIPFCAKLEEELSTLSTEESLEYLNSLGIEETGLNRLVKATFDMLGLITFITTGEMETRAWTITKGTTAQHAAGEIHTDIEKGFIRAEVIKFDDMVRYKTRAAAREAGKARSEGKDYCVEDGDVILFYHN